MSYNNIHDADAALGLIQEFEEPTAVIIKHTNPCGVASADTLVNAYTKALASDPTSAFGGIIAVNRTICDTLAIEFSKMFLEAIIAPRCNGYRKRNPSKEKESSTIDR